MRILSLHYGPYVAAHGGGSKADRFILEALSDKGHDCRALIPTSYGTWKANSCLFLHSLTERNITHKRLEYDNYQFRLNGVDVHAISEKTQADFFRMLALRARARTMIETWSPDCVFVTGSDRFHLQLETAITYSSKVIYFVRSSVDLGLGPFCIAPSPRIPGLLSQAAAIVCPSQYLSAYIERWTGLSARVVDVPVYGEGPFEEYRGVNSGHVVLVNPCAIKGITIFERLADLLPNMTFGAVPTWGTSSDDLNRLASLRNVRLLPPSDDIDDVFQHVKVLLMPSLWDEAFGRLCVEAMLRGIPVLASDVGGLPEAKLGVEYLLPVCPIQGYTDGFSGERVPVPVVPAQDIRPWMEVLQDLVIDKNRRIEISNRSRSASLQYVRSLSIAPIEELVREVAKEKTPRLALHSTNSLPEAFQRLSSERISLLAAELRLKKI